MFLLLNTLDGESIVNAFGFPGLFYIHTIVHLHMSAQISIGVLLAVLSTFMSLVSCIVLPCAVLKDLGKHLRFVILGVRILELYATKWCGKLN